MSAATLMLIYTTATSLCAAFCACVPAPPVGSNKWIVYGYRAVNVLGWNFNHAVNKSGE